MTVVAVPLWVDKAILIAVPVIWVIVFITAVAVACMAALGDRQTIVFPHDARDGVAPHPGPGAGLPSPVPGPRGRRP